MDTTKNNDTRTADNNAQEKYMGSPLNSSPFPSSLRGEGKGEDYGGDNAEPAYNYKIRKFKKRY